MANITGTANPDFIHRAGDGLLPPVGFNEVTGVTLGDDVINGLDNGDIIFADEGNDTVNGGLGNDGIRGGAGIDTVRGDFGNDDIFGDADNDEIFGGSGIDTIQGGAGIDFLDGGPDNDFIDGGADNDRMLGDDGIDFLTGGAGMDNMEGGEQNDFLLINAADEVAPNETYDGGDGIDTLAISTDETVDLTDVTITSIEQLVSDGAVRAKANQISGKDLLDTAGSVTFTTGGAGAVGTVALSFKTVLTQLFILHPAGNNLFLTSVDDASYTVQGNAGSDQVVGGTNNDVIDGGGNPDDLNGQSGNDDLTGGPGNDIVRGGPGSDTAHFSDVRDNYEIAQNGGITTVTHVGGSGSDGSDEIHPDVEKMQFADGPDETAYAVLGWKTMSAARVPDIGNVLINGAGLSASNITYGGAFSASGILKNGHNFGAGIGAIGECLLVTNGDVTMPLSNSNGLYSTNNNQAGDADLTAAAQAATGSQSSVPSFDASVIEFELTVTDPETSFVSLAAIFGSDEFPSATAVDLAGVWVNGVNYARFNMDPHLVLGVNDETAPWFFDNYPGIRPIEYNGVLPLMDIFAPVNQGANVIKIAIGDLVDRTVDSALWIGDLQDQTTGAPGAFFFMTGTGGNDNIEGTDRPEHIRLGDGVDLAHAGGGNDIVRGEGGADTIVAASGAGNDLYDGGADIDTVVFSSATQTVTVNLSAASNQAVGAEIGTDQIVGVENVTGGAGGDSITGNAVANALIGGGGNDTLNGLAGIDAMTGGAGDDQSFVDNAGDVVNELAGQGSDRVWTSLSYTLTAGASIETFTTTNNAGTAAINLTGNAAAQAIVGNAGANIINGAAGADIMQGLAGNDWYYVDSSADRAVEAAGKGSDRVLASASFALEAGSEIELLRTTNDAGTGVINLTGNNLANHLYGNAGAGTLDGRAGNDIMQGLGGNDIYMVDAAGDRAVEAAGKGSDRVLASASFALEANSEIELLKTTNDAGTGAINLAGNNLANHLLGNAGANTLDGKAGVDILQGLGGNDFYFVDNAADRAVEAAGKGADRVFASVSYTLEAGSEIETLTPTAFGGTGALNLTGNAIANTVYGNAGGNILNGGLGNDTLVGLAGADSFLFNSALNAATNVDRLADFNVAADTIRLENAIFTTLAAGTLAAGAFRAGTAALDADDRIIHNSSAGTLRYDADGAGAGAAVLFATLSAGLALTNADFFVV